MRNLIFFVGVIVSGLAFAAGAEAASCYPVKSDVVSLGEKAARAYGERALDREIEERKNSLMSSGAGIGKIGNRKIDCKHFPNVLGADEWRCVGAAKVCAKS